MKTVVIFTLSVVTTALAAPAAQQPQKGPSMENSLSNMITGAASFPAAFLSGNPKAAQDSLAQMIQGAYSFPEGFFADVGKGTAVA